jgi:hypothetical protein
MIRFRIVALRIGVALAPVLARTPRHGRRRPLHGPLALAAAVLLVGASAVRALTEEQCQVSRAKAAGKYANCVQKALATFTFTPLKATVSVAAGKCVAKYAATWANLRKQSGGSGTCAAARFVDNGDGTVTDNLTALQWEKKDNLEGLQNFPDPHDADNTYQWSFTGTVADGSAFTTFLASDVTALNNNGSCFAGDCDWRLPTRNELLAIALPPFPACLTSPCIDPIFGPTQANAYWTSSTVTTLAGNAWVVGFVNGVNFATTADETFAVFVRAVRGGL